MKKITVISPVVLNTSGASYQFAPKVEYEVADDIANHPYLRGFIATCIDITKPEEEPAPKRPPSTRRGVKNGRANH